MTDAKSHSYGAATIRNLSPRDHVRLRPSTYVGGTGSAALLHIADELMANSCDEALAGYCRNIWLTIDKDTRVTVRDDGRGVPIGQTVLASGKTVPTVQAAFTEMLTGGKYSDGPVPAGDPGSEGAAGGLNGIGGPRAAAVSDNATSAGSGYEGGVGGLNGIGAKCSVYLARETKVEVRRDGIIYTQTYKNGKKGAPDDVLTIEPPLEKPYKGTDTGTSVTFLYDETIFDADVHLDGERVKRKCYNLSRLVPGLAIHFEDKRSGDKETLVSKEGLPDFVRDLNDGESPLFKDIVYLRARREVEDANRQPTPLGVEVAFQPAATETPEERGNCFTNMVHNSDGGTHLAGFRKGLTRALNSYFKKNGLAKAADAGFENSDVMAGLAFTLSIRVNGGAVQYESQTKRNLTSTWVDGAVANVVADAMADWLADHPGQAKAWFTYLTEIRKAREAMMADRKAVKAKVGGGSLDPLLSKLSRETIKDPVRAEIYFVEGDSAGGNAKQARDRAHQAILPFRGKMLNAVTADRKKALENEDVRRIATALETGMGQHFDLERLRYHKIIFMADADADGGHIGFLWLSALWVFMPELIRRGHVYFAVPPLFSVYDYKTKRRSYFYSERDLRGWTRGRASESYTVTRFKGLGEMQPEHLRETAMSPLTRRLKRVVVNDIAELKELINDLMGSQAAKRRAFMDEHARGKTTREDVELTA